MKILITGGSGDLGRVIAPQFVARGDTTVNLDVSPPPSESVTKFIQGSILNRQLLETTLRDIDCVIHIAAWHGIHEFRKNKDAFDFWELNVNGTFNLLECCARAGCKKFVFISSTSVDDWPGMYAHSKVVAEDLMRTYAARHDMKIISLRPRAFIPHWNTAVYANISQWAQWYWKGAVHIDDVAQAVIKATQTLQTDPPLSNEHKAVIIDGRCDFSEDELAHWDKDGAGTTFKKHFGDDNYRLAVKSGLDPAQRPHILGYTEAAKAIGYAPEYGFAQMLNDLANNNEIGLQGITSV